MLIKPNMISQLSLFIVHVTYWSIIPAGMCEEQRKEQRCCCVSVFSAVCAWITSEYLTTLARVYMSKQSC